MTYPDRREDEAREDIVESIKNNVLETHAKVLEMYPKVSALAEMHSNTTVEEHRKLLEMLKDDYVTRQERRRARERLKRKVLESATGWLVVGLLTWIVTSVEPIGRALIKWLWSGK